jgi:hypothetical protein
MASAMGSVKVNFPRRNMVHGVSCFLNQKLFFAKFAG